MEELTIGQLATFQKGFAFKSSDYKNRGIRVIKVANLNQQRFDDASCAFIDESIAKEYMRYELLANDIVISTVGSWINNPDSVVGKVASIPSSVAGSLLNQNAVRLRANHKVLQKYLYYALSSDDFRNYIVGTAQGSANQASITLEDIKKYTLHVPTYDIQSRIISILSSIDSKIELNRCINDNLEKQAQALYKSWFVDFEPFCEGEFIESSLGSIPAGWKVGQLSDICEIVGGGTPPKSHPEYYCKRGIAWITPKDLSVSKSKFSSRGSEDITSDGYKNSSAKLMPRGTVLFSSRAPIGYISIATNEICTNQGFKSAVPGIAGTGYLYYFLQANTDKIESKASGSTFKEASGSLMRALEVIIPTDGIFNQFEAELALILTKQENIASEIQTLTALRDTLLPKLISGELKINELDC